MESGGDLLSRTVTSQVPSALKGLTSVFGMGTGVTPSSLPPEMVSYSFPHLDNCTASIQEFVDHSFLFPAIVVTQSRFRLWTTVAGEAFAVLKHGCFRQLAQDQI